MCLPKNITEAPSILLHLNERLGHIRDTSPELFPDFSSATELLAVSDYSNDDEKGTYQVITFFISDFSNAQASISMRNDFRRNTIGFEREFQYKKLNQNQDRERLRLLDEFLATFNSINGVIFSVLVHKNIRYLFGRPTHTILNDEGLGKWKPHISEKLLRVLHIQALFIFGLSKPNQTYLWMTDRDAITTQLDTLGKLTQRIFSIYAPFPFSRITYAEPLGTLHDPFKDFLAIPDLVGGAVLELLRNQNDKYSLDIEHQTLVKLKTYKILNWIHSPSKNVKHFGCRIYGDPKAPMVSFFNLKAHSIIQ